MSIFEIMTIYILQNWPSSSGGGDFKFCECIFAHLLLSPNVKRYGLLIWTNLNPFYLSGSIEEDF